MSFWVIFGGWKFLRGDDNSTSAPCRYSISALAAQNGHLALSKILVDAGSNMDFQDLIGNTPLHTAVHNTHTEIAKYLVASGANEFKRNSSGLTPFQLSGK